LRVLLLICVLLGLLFLTKKIKKLGRKTKLFFEYLFQIIAAITINHLKNLEPQILTNLAELALIKEDQKAQLEARDHQQIRDGETPIKDYSDQIRNLEQQIQELDSLKNLLKKGPI
jgi:hypothetical protein